MENISIKVKDFIANAFPEAIMSALEDACQMIENTAVDKCPVDDGTLRASITHSVEREENKFVGAVGSNLEYAPYVHEGTGIYAREGKGRTDVPWNYQDDEGNWHSTSGQKPNPYMRPALEENRENIKRILKEGLMPND